MESIISKGIEATLQHFEKYRNAINKAGLRFPLRSELEQRFKYLNSGMDKIEKEYQKRIEFDKEALLQELKDKLNKHSDAMLRGFSDNYILNSINSQTTFDSVVNDCCEFNISYKFHLSQFRKVKGEPVEQYKSNIKEQSRTKELILNTFTGMDEKGWEYAFISEYDYILFTDLLTKFFEYKDYCLPKKVIQLKKRCKTKVAKALGDIHRELSNEKSLISDANYFKIVKTLSHFEHEAKEDLYKAMTR